MTRSKNKKTKIDPLIKYLLNEQDYFNNTIKVKIKPVLNIPFITEPLIQIKVFNTRFSYVFKFYCKKTLSEQVIHKMLMGTKVGIIGSRRIDLQTTLQSPKTLDKLLKIYKPSCLISGGAKGSDSLAENYAISRKYHFIRILPTLYVKSSTIYSYKNLYTSYKKMLVCAPRIITPHTEIKKMLIYRNKILAQLVDAVISLKTPKKSGTAYTIIYALRYLKHIIYADTNITPNSGASFFLKHNIGTKADDLIT